MLSAILISPYSWIVCFQLSCQKVFISPILPVFLSLLSRSVLFFPLILLSAILCITLAFFQMVNPFWKTAEVLIIGLHFKGFRELGFPSGLWESEKGLPKEALFFGYSPESANWPPYWGDPLRPAAILLLMLITAPSLSRVGEAMISRILLSTNALNLSTSSRNFFGRGFSSFASSP